MESMEQVVSSLRKSFSSGKTKAIDYRCEQLNALKRLVLDNSAFLCEALSKDLGKCRTESLVFELDLLEAEITGTLRQIHNWAKPEYVYKTLMYKAMACYISKDPLGTVLIIGAWNYPIQLTLTPLVGAIAAGNCAIVKPSEVAPNTAEALAKLIPKYLDSECYRVVTGGVSETTELLEQQFDKIFYTGNGTVGRIVLQAAAKFLTPVVLELGGKCPTFVANDADLVVSANRIVWAKLVNCGQTCVAPDYVLCSESIQNSLASHMKDAIERFYGPDASESPDYGKIVNERHFDRLESLLEDKLDIYYGGRRDRSKLFLSPTIILDATPGLKCMQDEVFGPVLPVMTVESEEEAIEFINSKPKPLGLYVFSNSTATIQKFRTSTSSGAFVANDAVIHGGLPTLPFGGVGASGMGSYHGKFSFDVFTHQKACVEAPVKLVEGANMKMRYPPYTDKKLEWARWVIYGKGGSCSIL